LAEASDLAQRRFLSVARPILEEVMRETGASVLLDARSVLLAVDNVDITAEAVLRIDQTIGAGEDIDLLGTLGADTRDTSEDDSRLGNGEGVEPENAETGNKVIPPGPE